SSTYACSASHPIVSSQPDLLVMAGGQAGEKADSQPARAAWAGRAGVGYLLGPVSLQSVGAKNRVRLRLPDPSSRAGAGALSLVVALFPAGVCGDCRVLSIRSADSSGSWGLPQGAIPREPGGRATAFARATPLFDHCGRGRKRHTLRGLRLWTGV